MAKVKIGKWEIDEIQLDQQHTAAIQRGEEWLKVEPQAQSVTYSLTSEKLILEMKNGVIFQIPRLLVQGLENASPDKIAQVKLGPRGASLHWETLDLDFSVAGLLTGIFGTRTWMAEIGRRGGLSSSPAKAEAARQNGKKGGRVAQVAIESTQP